MLKYTHTHTRARTHTHTHTRTHTHTHAHTRTHTHTHARAREPTGLAVSLACLPSVADAAEPAIQNTHCYVIATPAVATTVAAAAAVRVCFGIGPTVFNCLCSCITVISSAQFKAHALSKHAPHNDNNRVMRKRGNNSTTNRTTPQSIAPRSSSSHLRLAPHQSGVVHILSRDLALA